MRKVQQISPKTVLKKVKSGERTKFWASGFKIEKYAGDETQFIYTKFLEPQEVTVTYDDFDNKWVGADSIVRLLIFLDDGTKLSRYESNERGINFYDTQELAEKHFIDATYNLFKQVETPIRLYQRYRDKIEKADPAFLSIL